MIKHATSRKSNGRFQYKRHELGNAEYEQLDAYFSPNGQFNLTFVMDGRVYNLQFDEEQSKRMAKRLCVDTLDRALKLLTPRD